MSELAERLALEFADKDYAHAYMESHRISRIAAQVYALRKQRNWSQRQLAEHSGIAQERISKIESADFSSLTLSTLNKLARAFDVDLRVAFDSFGQGILDVVNLSPAGLEVLSRDDALDTLKTRRLMLDQNHEWRAVDVPKLARALPITPVAPALPSGQWARLG